MNNVFSKVSLSDFFSQVKISKDESALARGNQERTGNDLTRMMVDSASNHHQKTKNQSKPSTSFFTKVVNLVKGKKMVAPRLAAHAPLMTKTNQSKPISDYQPLMTPSSHTSQKGVAPHRSSSLSTSVAPESRLNTAASQSPSSSERSHVKLSHAVNTWLDDVAQKNVDRTTQKVYPLSDSSSQSSMTPSSTQTSSSQSSSTDSWDFIYTNQDRLDVIYRPKVPKQAKQKRPFAKMAEPSSRINLSPLTQEAPALKTQQTKVAQTESSVVPPRETPARLLTTQFLDEIQQAYQGAPKPDLLSRSIEAAIRLQPEHIEAEIQTQGRHKGAFDLPQKTSISRAGRPILLSNRVHEKRDRSISGDSLVSIPEHDTKKAKNTLGMMPINQRV